MCPDRLLISQVTWLNRELVSELQCSSTVPWGHPTSCKLPSLAQELRFTLYDCWNGTPSRRLFLPLPARHSSLLPPPHVEVLPVLWLKWRQELSHLSLCPWCMPKVLYTSSKKVAGWKHSSANSWLAEDFYKKCWQSIKYETSQGDNKKCWTTNIVWALTHQNGQWLWVTSAAEC